MEIVINVDGEKFQDIVQKELEAFSEQELHELCRQGILMALNSTEAIQKLFTRKTDVGYYYNEPQANELLKEAAKTVNFDELFKPFQDKVIEYVKEHHMDIIREIIYKSFLNGLSYNLGSSCEFQNQVRQELYNMNLNG